MLSCREAARLLSESLEEPLPFRRRLSLRFHVMMCRLCRRYGGQIRLLDRVFRKHGEIEDDTTDAAGASLSADAKARLKAVLSEES